MIYFYWLTGLGLAILLSVVVSTTLEPMNKVLRGLARAVSLLAAVAVAAVIILYPRLVAEDSASVPHGFLVVLLMGMSAAWVHGFGFVPENRILRVLFSPVVAWPVMLIGTWGVFLR